MKRCPNCGGFFDDDLMVCPIDGFDFSSVIKEEARKRRIEKIKKTLKYVFYASLIIVIIIVVVLLVKSNLFTGKSAFNERIGYLSGMASQTVGEKNMLLKRIGRIGRSMNTAAGRFQFAVHNTDQASIRSFDLARGIESVRSRLSCFHFSMNQAAVRFRYAFYRIQNTIQSVR